MKLSPEQFDALVEYINAKAASASSPHDRYLSERTVYAYAELEDQLKGDQDEAQP